MLARELPHLGGSQVEFYSLEYAAALMPHAPTWPLAAAYLAWCPAHGQVGWGGEGWGGGCLARRGGVVCETATLPLF